MLLCSCSLISLTELLSFIKLCVVCEIVAIPFHGSSVQEEVDMLLSRGRSLGVSNLRFMPKPSSLRAITNLSSVAKLNATQFPAVNQMGRREAKPVNTQLFDLFSVLKFEKVSAAICLVFGQLFV